jgi:hypothetical protein
MAAPTQYATTDRVVRVYEGVTRTLVNHTVREPNGAIYRSYYITLPGDVPAPEFTLDGTWALCDSLGIECGVPPHRIPVFRPQPYGLPVKCASAQP